MVLRADDCFFGQYLSCGISGVSGYWEALCTLCSSAPYPNQRDFRAAGKREWKSSGTSSVCRSSKEMACLPVIFVAYSFPNQGEIVALRTATAPYLFKQDIWGHYLLLWVLNIINIGS